MAGGLEPGSRELVRRLRDAPTQLTRDLRTELTRAGDQVAARTRAAIVSASSHHDGSLRAEIAGTVSARGTIRRAGAAVVLESDGTKMPAGKENLAALADGEWPWQRWRHPVWGHRDRWVDQNWTSAHGWFSRTIRDESPSFAAAVQAALDETSARIEGRG